MTTSTATEYTATTEHLNLKSKTRTSTLYKKYMGTQLTRNIKDGVGEKYLMLIKDKS